MAAALPQTGPSADRAWRRSSPSIPRSSSSSSPTWSASRSPKGARRAEGPMSMAPAVRRSSSDHGLGSRHPSAWRMALYTSVLLWVAMAAGNVALYAVRPTGHWPLLESVEALQVASLIPIALLLERVSGGSAAGRLVTAIGIAALLVALAIDAGFVTGLVAFGIGPLGGP